ncbi:MAG: FHA domain-containing protein [Phycisphaerae bacterium]|nr:FHA domain-containing protein [Phycisphaerae bacterium]
MNHEPFILSVSQQGREIVRRPLTHQPLTIGRIPTNDVPLNHAQVSRNHARIVRTEEGWEIIDLGSQNGIRVGGVRVDRHRLKGGDEIGVGPFTLTVANAPAAVPPSRKDPGPSAVADDGPTSRLLKQVTCHHCWYQFAPDEVLWIARHQDLSGDPVVGPNAPLRFRPSRFNVKGEAIDARNIPCSDLACPRCHLSVPRLMLEHEPRFISIIGGPASGKTYLLAAMTWELRRTLKTRFATTFVDADPIANAILADYENTLFHGDPDTPARLEKTPMESRVYTSVSLGGQTVLLPQPFIFHMAPDRPLDLAGREPLGRVLCLYDNAGEHFLPGGDSAVRPGTQHVARSRALLFVFDPTQSPRFRLQCRTHGDGPQLSDESSATNRQDRIMTEAAMRVRQYSQMDSLQKLRQPLLVLVSKSDLWASLLDEETTTDPIIPRSRLGAQVDAVDFERIERISVKVRNLLLAHTPEFVSAAEGTCARVVYLPVSALGHAPELDQEKKETVVYPRNISPRWVSVPLLWVTGRR